MFIKCQENFNATRVGNKLVCAAFIEHLYFGFLWTCILLIQHKFYFAVFMFINLMLLIKNLIDLVIKFLMLQLR